MITIETFQSIRESYGHCASWAVWADVGNSPKSGIGDLSVLNPARNPTLLDILHTEVVFLGLNISRRIEKPFGNFHDVRPMGMDFKLRYALQNTQLWGAYMTDIIKDFEEKASGKLMQYLRSNPGFEKMNLDSLKSELNLLGCKSPTLIAIGKDAEKIAVRNLGNNYRIIGIPHYAMYISKENYRRQVLHILDA